VGPAIARSNNGTLAALASRNTNASAKWASKLGIPHIYSTYAALLGDPDIDAVYIPLPNSAHAEWAINAAKAGKHVLCEKPLALDADQAGVVVDACARHGVMLLEGFMYRFHPQHSRVRAIIDTGTIGEIVEVQAHLSVDIMSPVDAGNIRFIPALGGGCLLDMGCYVSSISRMVMGEEPTSIQGTWRVDERFNVDVSASAIMTFPSGRSAVASCSFEGNGQGFYRIVGRKGMIEVPRGILPGLGDRESETLLIVSDANGRRIEESLPPVDQYQLMVEAFADAILRGIPLPVSSDDAVANMHVLDAWAESARSGRAIAAS
jgi:D-xylose 1-dehydrogenase (NADP+, D-xylono-1,5-lactone-forming)